MKKSKNINLDCNMEDPIFIGNNKDLKIDTTKNRVWVQIRNVGVAFDKANFICLIEQSEEFKFAKSLEPEYNAKKRNVIGSARLKNQ